MTTLPKSKVSLSRPSKPPDAAKGEERRHTSYAHVSKLLSPAAAACKTVSRAAVSVIFNNAALRVAEQPSLPHAPAWVCIPSMGARKYLTASERTEFLRNTMIAVRAAFEAGGKSSSLRTAAGLGYGWNETLARHNARSCRKSTVQKGALPVFAYRPERL